MIFMLIIILLMNEVIDIANMHKYLMKKRDIE